MFSFSRGALNIWTAQMGGSVSCIRLSHVGWSSMRLSSPRGARPRNSAENAGVVCVIDSSSSVTPRSSSPRPDEDIIDAFLCITDPLDLLVFINEPDVYDADSCRCISHFMVAINKDWLPLESRTMYAWDGKYPPQGAGIQVLRSILVSCLTTPGTNIGLCKLRSNPLKDTHKPSPAAQAELQDKISDTPASGALLYPAADGPLDYRLMIELYRAVFPRKRHLIQPNMRYWLAESIHVAALYERLGIIPIDPADNDDFTPVSAEPAICDVPPIWLKNQRRMCRDCTELLCS